MRLLRRDPWPRLLVVVLAGIAILAAVVAISAFLDGSELLRPLFGYALLGEPFAVVGAVLLDRRSAGFPKLAILRGLVLAMAVQLPVTIYQLLVVSPRYPAETTAADYANGTLVGVLSGPHIVGVLAVVAIAVAISSSWSRRWRLLAVAALLPLPLLTDTKVAILVLPLAIPLALLVARARTRLTLLSACGAIALVALLLTVPALNRGYAGSNVSRVLDGEGGKAQAAEIVGRRLTEDPASLLFGLGPAESVSHAAMLTVKNLRQADSPIEVLDLRPGEVARRFDKRVYFIGTFESPRSGALGVVGDYGALGALTYLTLVIFLAASLRNARSRLRYPAAFALVFMLVLGPLGEWWEQGHFTVIVGLLVGIALADRTDPVPVGPPPQMRAEAPRRGEASEDGRATALDVSHT